MMRRLASWSLGLVVFSLLALALWFRTTSLEGVGEPNGDEAYFGIQAAHLLWGGPVALRTNSGNILDPITTWTQVPLLLIWKPALWILRVPSIITGILAVVLVYVLSARFLDQTTGLIAAVLVATVPECIIFARTGCEYSQVPLLCAICLYYALKPGRLGLWAWFLVSVLIYGTNIFLLPMLLTVALTRLLRPIWRDRTQMRPILVEAGLASWAIVATIKALTVHQAGRFHQAFYRPMDWPVFLGHFGRFFSGIVLYGPLPERVERLHIAAFWGVVVTALVFGGYRLVRRRDWDRIALVVGWMLSVGAFHVIAGSQVLTMRTSRYGAFLLVPTILAVATLIEAVLPRSATRLTWRRWQTAAIVLTLGGGLLGTLKVNWLDDFSRSGAESIWTFRTDQADPKQRAFEAVLADIARTGRARLVRPASASASTSARHAIIAEDWLIYRPIQFLAVPRRDVQLVWYYKLDEHEPRRRSVLCDQLRRGAYAIGYGNPDRNLAQTIRAAFPRDDIEQFDIPDRNGGIYLKVFRLKVPDPAAADGLLARRTRRIYPFEFETDGARLVDGLLVSDPGRPGPNFAYGPYLDLSTGRYRANFRLKSRGDLAGCTALVLDVFERHDQDITFHAREILEGERLQRFAQGEPTPALNFRLKKPAAGVEFRVILIGQPANPRLEFEGVDLLAEADGSLADAAGDRRAPAR